MSDEPCPLCGKEMTPSERMLPWILYGTEWYLRANTTGSFLRLVCADCTPTVRAGLTKGEQA